MSFLVADWSRWDKYRRAPWRQDSSASASDAWRREDQEQLIVSWCPIEKRVMDAAEDYLESCAQIVVDIDVVERLLRPENLEVSLKSVLKHATRRGSNIFQLFDTPEKPNHFVASRRRWLESQGRNGARQDPELGQKLHCAPEGEAEVSEIIIVSDAVVTFVDLDGESRREQVEPKLSRREREMLNEGEEIRSPKKKVIRVESEETQDCVREEKITEFEEEKQRTLPLLRL